MSKPASFSRRVIVYQQTRGRQDLPWQHSKTRYRVWISEIMLQQTQVATVLPYFRRFIRAFPNLKRLADAPLDAVLAQWSGLGYYARARHLHQAARLLRHEGPRLPRTVDDWMRLPGVGRSTAGAIVSLAENRPAPMLDGNARRVLTRHQGLPPQQNAALWHHAQRLLPTTDAAAYTQGLMDLGAQVCTARNPGCGSCPLREDCQYRATPVVEATRKRPTVRSRRRWLTVLHSHDHQILLQPRPSEGLWGGLWGFPEFTSRSAAQHWGHQRSQPLQWRELPVLTHRLSHLNFRLHPLYATIPKHSKMPFAEEGRWFDPHSIDVGVAAIVTKLLQQVPCD